jgi:hypothetical protein
MAPTRIHRSFISVSYACDSSPFVFEHCSLGDDVVEYPASSRSNPKTFQIQEQPDGWEKDPCWAVACRAVAGRHFAKSILLTKFLLYVVSETLAGRENQITEHQIGVRVFGRSPDYLTAEDNIVRNYARQLRKRLAEHFASEGRSEAWRIEIPCGGYVPVFTQVPDAGSVEERSADVSVDTKLRSEPVPGARSEDRQLDWRQRGLRLLALAFSAALLVAVTWFAATHARASHAPADPTRTLWAALLSGPANSYIVPADAGFNLLQDLSHQSLPLAEYIQGGYLELPLAQVDTHSAEDLRSQQFTSFVDLQIVTALARRPEFDPRRVILRFPRDLRIDDLKNANAVIIGSVGSNPWAAVAQESSNFPIVYQKDMQGAMMRNVNPQPGEATFYVSHWNEAAHETFAAISYLPNLSGNGHLLLLQGLDVAGTQAAAETLFRDEVLAPILRRCTRADGSLRFFEVLLRSKSIQSTAAETQVIAVRIH